MIAGEPRIVERDGARRLVDGDGEQLVVRLKAHSQGRHYHHADLDAFEAGEIRPACRIDGCKPPGSWTLCRETTLDSIWSQCSFGPCFGGARSNAPRGREDEQSEGYDRRAVAALARSRNHKTKSRDGETVR